MAEITPFIFTDIHDGEFVLNKPSNEETMRKLGQNYNYLGDLIPLASIITINSNQIGAEPVNTDIWQFCDGSEIVHPDSPLRSIGINTRFVPDISEKYIKGADTLNTNPQGGSQTINFSHNHGPTGSSGINLLIYDNDGDDNALKFDDLHAHTVNPSGSVTVDYPKWLKVAAHMKIQ